MIDESIVKSCNEWYEVEKAVVQVPKTQLLRCDYYYVKGIEKFNCSPLIGNYANLYWNHVKSFDIAEELYLKAIGSDKNNVWPICNYATFLWDVRKKHDEAERYYEQALALDKTHLDTILNYADFLSEVREQHDKAEQFYIDGLIIHDSPKLMGHYGLFLLMKRKDALAAGEMYKKASEISPNNAEALGNYAWFLSSDYNRNYDEAEKYYLKSINCDPKYLHAIYNYAMFLQDDRKDTKKSRVVLQILYIFDIILTFFL